VRAINVAASSVAHPEKLLRLEATSGVAYVMPLQGFLVGGY